MNASGKPVPAKEATRGAFVTSALEMEILNGTLQPGDRLDEEGIGKRFGVSRTPVREAFKHLASAGLIDIKPHSGAFVATLTIAGVVEMFEMMAVLEAACAALAARRHDIHDRAALNAAQAACRSAALAEDPDSFYQANAQLHEVIYRACHNSYIEGQALTLRQRLEPYRRGITFHPGLMHKSMSEHQSVIDAILRMDEAAARDTMARHFDTLLSDVVAMVEALNRPRLAARQAGRARGKSPAKAPGKTPARRAARKAA